MLTLIKKAVRGDKEAFLQLMDMQKDTMLRIAHGYLSQEANVADAIQDTILDAYGHLSSLKEPRYFKRRWNGKNKRVKFLFPFCSVSAKKEAFLFF